MSAAAAAPLVSMVTTSKGRLASLRQSLPRMLAQPHAEVIVVDYDCPQGTGTWVAAEHPAARVVKVSDAPLFNIARARNRGAQVARGEWLFFVDADIVLDDRFIEQALPRLKAGAFYAMDHAKPDTVGTVLCRREDFVALEGYDEVLQDWGPEDRDLRLRLTMLGRVQDTLPGAWIGVIEHDDNARVCYYEIKDRWLSQRINASYAQIKHDLARQFGKLNLPLALRCEVYAEVRQTLQRGAETGDGSARIQITLPPELELRFYGWQVKRTWVYEISPARDAGGASRGAAAAASLLHVRRQ